MGYNVFAIQSRGECWTTSTAGETYEKYGKSTACSVYGYGGVLAQEVYNITKMYKGECWNYEMLYLNLIIFLWS